MLIAALLLVLLVLGLNAVATVVIAKRDGLSAGGRTVQLLMVWLLPLVGPSCAWRWPRPTAPGSGATTVPAVATIIRAAIPATATAITATAASTAAATVAAVTAAAAAIEVPAASSHARLPFAPKPRRLIEKQSSMARRYKVPGTAGHPCLPQNFQRRLADTKRGSP